MKFSHIVAVLALLGISTQAAGIQDKLEQDRVNKLFSGFVGKFKRNYKNNGEFQNRLSNFQKNLKLVEEHNAKNKDFQLETNKFADLSDDEFQHMMGLNAASLNEATINAQADPYFANAYSQQCDTEPVVGGVDWRTQGIISNVKNQASCGGCYAFSSLESLQAYYHMKKGKASAPTSVLNLSEQQVIDCSSSYGNNGCNGGLMSNTFNYLKAYPIMLEADYGYNAKKGTCQYAAAKGQFKVTSYVNLPKNDPAALLAAVKNQPISVALRAGSSVVQLYKSGVITSTACGTAIDHAVTLIGYGTEGGNDYWLLKNSWGDSWGEKGYFKILRTTAKDAGICGILSLSSYPTGISI